METVFFFRIYRSRGVCKKSHNHYSMYYNLQETALEYKGLSLPLMLRSFTPHMALIRPLIDACVYSSHTTHVMKRLSSLRL